MRSISNTRILLALIMFPLIWLGFSIWDARLHSGGQTAAVVMDEPGETLATSTLATTTAEVKDAPPIVSTSSPPLYPYIEIVDSCGPYYQGTCVNMRSGPGTEYPVVLRLRNGVVLKVAETVTTAGGEKWYKIAQTEDIKYPERITTDWYVAAHVAQLFQDDGDHYLTDKSATTDKRIVVDRSQQMLYAYDGDTLFMQSPISTGLELTPTPRGTFKVFKMTPSRYMQGPIKGVSDQYYDLPGVPWNLYFTVDGAVIHGAYWHDHFGEPWSHGCVNLPLDAAKKLYLWADIGTKVTVQD